MHKSNKPVENGATSAAHSVRRGLGLLLSLLVALLFEGFGLYTLLGLTRMGLAQREVQTWSRVPIQVLDVQLNRTDCDESDCHHLTASYRYDWAGQRRESR